MSGFMFSTLLVIKLCLFFFIGSMVEFLIIDVYLGMAFIFE